MTPAKRGKIKAAVIVAASAFGFGLLGWLWWMAVSRPAAEPPPPETGEPTFARERATLTRLLGSGESVYLLIDGYVAELALFPALASEPRTVATAPGGTLAFAISPDHRYVAFAVATTPELLAAGAADKVVVGDLLEPGVEVYDFSERPAGAKPGMLAFSADNELLFVGGGEARLVERRTGEISAVSNAAEAGCAGDYYLGGYDEANERLITGLQCDGFGLNQVWSTAGRGLLHESEASSEAYRSGLFGFWQGGEVLAYEATMNAGEAGPVTRLQGRTAAGRVTETYFEIAGTITQLGFTADREGFVFLAHETGGEARPMIVRAGEDAAEPFTGIIPALAYTRADDGQVYYWKTGTGIENEPELLRNFGGSPLRAGLMVY
jgi:hypothetical protein